MNQNSTEVLQLQAFLEHKTLYYDKIDFNTIKIAWEFVRMYVKLPYVIHIVGTNGKGSTGRFLAHYLHQKNYKVLHYSSPHILTFNERIWVGGNSVKDEVLEEFHQALQTIIPQKLLAKLTYFEYTTLLALLICSGMDYLVLEAGLGGEFDATNVVINDLSLITPIDFDHQQFLGNSIDAIARTKLRSCDNTMIVAQQKHQEVYSVAADFNFKKTKKYDTSCLKHLPFYLKENLNLVCSALEHLNIVIEMQCFKNVQIPGRFEKIASNITLDVGHNPLAATVIANELLQNKQKVSLVYNSFDDKDYKKVLEILKPVITEVLIIEVDDKRIVKQELLEEVCKVLDIEYASFTTTNPSKNYLVFGSFSVAEKFLLLKREHEK
jgi:dihydrofolate synthase/folylpolyglutamate synthase